MPKNRTICKCPFQKETNNSNAYCMGGFGLYGVGIPVKIVSLAFDPGIEGSEVGQNHIIGKLTPVRRFPCCEGIGIPDECCFCVAN